MASGWLSRFYLEFPTSLPGINNLRKEGQQVLTCEISLFPLEVQNSDEIINQSIEALKKTGVKHEVGNMSTYLYSDNPEDIWTGIKAIYNEAEKAGTEFSLSINLSNNT